MRCVVIFSCRYYDSEGQQFPPIGTVGDIVSDLDDYGEYDVIFDSYPCLATPQDPTWVTHKSHISLIDDKKPDNFVFSGLSNPQEWSGLTYV